MRSITLNKRSSQNQPQLGSVVLLADEKNPRMEWELGIIVKLHPGEDCIVRSVSVRRANGTIVKRSINMLIPLEISAADDSTWSQENSKTSDDADKETQAEQIRIREQPPRRAKRNVSYAECAQIIPDAKMNNIRNIPLLFTILMILGWLGRTSAAIDAPATSPNLQLRCIKGGIFISNLSPASEVQACAANHCIETRVLQREATVMFPASVCLHEHVVRVKAKYERETYISTILCPPSPFCEMIDYVFFVIFVNFVFVFLVSSPLRTPKTKFLS
ncbi:hypothetical protein ANCCEY_03670 [Ancylostoma ceylanicum]|uniref:DUF5641 domain-containing protein n=1 Tax=Ancylostoma ceylanicum TaxID=53326 RepID=A0A0D6LYS1_9BILA|nr:hypothetical protein ANCCEY_03670 [Ancylostoma ceylanicum]